MLNKTNPSDQGAKAPKNTWSNETFSTAATARRRALLKGLGRGTAVLAATVPIKTLAGQLCPSSGTMSAQVSQGISTSASCPTGFAPSHWSQASAKNSRSSINNWPPKTDQTAKYNSIFVQSNSDKQLIKILTDQPDSDESHWICAWLNSKAVSNFPYSADKVISLSDPAFHTQYVNTLTFLKKYMESKIS